MESNYSVEKVFENNCTLIKVTIVKNDKKHVKYYTEDGWKEYNEELKNPNRHIQDELEIRAPSHEYLEKLNEFIEQETPKYYSEHKEEDIVVKHITGMIPHTENTCSDGYDLFYKATLVPMISVNNNEYYVLIETGFDIYYEQKTFTCIYDSNRKTVTVQEQYRSVYDPESYEKYKSRIYYMNREMVKNGKDGVPYIRFPRTKDGVTIPQLIDAIFQNEENQIIFEL